MALFVGPRRSLARAVGICVGRCLCRAPALCIRAHALCVGIAGRKRQSATACDPSSDPRHPFIWSAWAPAPRAVSPVRGPPAQIRVPPIQPGVLLFARREPQTLVIYIYIYVYVYVVIVFTMRSLCLSVGVCVGARGPRRSLCRARALSVWARCSLCRGAALCVGARSLCRGPALCVGPQRSLPGSVSALSVGARSLCRTPALSVGSLSGPGDSFRTLSEALSVSGPSTHCRGVCRGPLALSVSGLAPSCRAAAAVFF